MPINTFFFGHFITQNTTVFTVTVLQVKIVLNGVYLVVLLRGSSTSLGRDPRESQTQSSSLPVKSQTLQYTELYLKKQITFLPISPPGSYSRISSLSFKKKSLLTLVQARSLFPFFIEPASLISFNTSFLSFIACCQNTNRKQTITLIKPHLARLHTQNVSPSPCRKISTALCSLDFFPVPFSLGSPGTRI